MKTNCICGSKNYDTIPIRYVTDVFYFSIGWEGGDEWIRAQFNIYLLSLLSTCTSAGKQFPSF